MILEIDQEVGIGGNMEEKYKESFAEVSEIFKLMPESMVNKIPVGLRTIIENEKSTIYKPDIKEPLEECKLKDETIIIMALIYRDFLCSKEEKEKLLQRDAEGLKKAEEELHEKYDVDNIFKKNKTVVEKKQEENVEETSLVEAKEEKWYQKIFNMIKGIFKKK